MYQLDSRELIKINGLISHDLRVIINKSGSQLHTLKKLSPHNLANLGFNPHQIDEIRDHRLTPRDLL